LLCAGESRVALGLTARVDSVGKQCCELCGRRLSKVQHHRPHGVGRACHPRCHDFKSAANDATSTVPSPSAAAAPNNRLPKRKRRAQSDPGQPPVFTPNRLRVRAPKPPAQDRKKQKQERQAAVLALLEETHARRMAALAAAASAAPAAAAPAVSPPMLWKVVIEE
jgi:hypothetical protein